MREKFYIFIIIIFILELVPINFSRATILTDRLKGKILLQVESHGEAWYVNPATSERYYMANGNAAYNIMRDLGIGITNKNLEKIKTNIDFAKQNGGKIFLQIEARGEAYYIDFNGKAHYLKDGSAAYSIMRDLGLGITNNDLNKILKNGQIDTSNLKLLNNTEIIEQLKDSVVYIETKESAGSGFIVESNGYILTNAHVVQGVSVANIILSNNTTLSASVVGRDENIDLALLKVNQTKLKKSLLGDSDGVKQGDEIFTLGYPFGIKGDVSFKEGTISRTLKSETFEYFEISADLHPGNSGGPLVNKYGQIIGISTAVFGKSIQGVSVGETIKLVIPINIAKNIMDDLKNGRSILTSSKKTNENESSQTDLETAQKNKIFLEGKYKQISVNYDKLYNLYDLEITKANTIINSTIGRAGKLNVAISGATETYKNGLKNFQGIIKNQMDVIQEILDVLDLTDVKTFSVISDRDMENLNKVTKMEETEETNFNTYKDSYDAIYSDYCAEMAKYGSKCDILY